MADWQVTTLHYRSKQGIHWTQPGKSSEKRKIPSHIVQLKTGGRPSFFFGNSDSVFTTISHQWHITERM
jgi:hypothetical protein